MLKIVYPVCCGMDIHKSFVAACIAVANDCGVTGDVAQELTAKEK